MALLFVDGFEHYATGDVGEKYTSVGVGSRNGSAARTGSASYTGSLNKALAASGATAIVGMGAYWDGGGNPLEIIICYGGFGTGSFYQCSIRSNAVGQVIAYRSDTTELGRSAVNVLRSGVWQHIEVKFVIDNSAGTVTVKVNGLQVLALTGQDTQNNASTSDWNGVTLNPSNGDWWMDDVYICDGSGSQCNDLLGECRVVTLLPSTGNGSNVDFTTSAGGSPTDHGAMVDEAAPDDDTTYVYSSTVDHVDTWNYPALGYTGTIKGVQMNLSAKKTDSGTRAIRAVTRPASTNRVHATDHYLGTSYVYWNSIWELNPEDSAAWEVADVDGAEFGVKVSV